MNNEYIKVIANAIDDLSLYESEIYEIAIDQFKLRFPNIENDKATRNAIWLVDMIRKHKKINNHA